jgi:serine/threonine protein kinase
VSEGAGDGSGEATGVLPGALTALLQEVAAAPEQCEAEPVSLPPGTVIGWFEIIRELGRGGFRVVYEAKDRHLGRQVAVKVVRPGRVTEEEGKVSREAEARAALDELIACCSHNGAWQIALAYDNAKDRDKAFEWLERARSNMDGGIRNLKGSPRFKGDPRTAEILRKMNLPVDSASQFRTPPQTLPT